MVFPMVFLWLSLGVFLWFFLSGIRIFKVRILRFLGGVTPTPDWLIKSRDPRGHSEDVGDDGGAAIPRRAGVSIEEWDRMPTKK